MPHVKSRLALSAAFGVAVIASVALADDDKPADDAPPVITDPDARLLDSIVDDLGELFDGAMGLPKMCHTVPTSPGDPPPPEEG